MGGVVHVFRGSEGQRQKIRCLVIGGNEDINGGQIAGCLRIRRFPFQRVCDDEEIDRQHDEAIHLGNVENDARNKVQEIRAVRQGFGRAPIGIAQCYHRRIDESHQTQGLVFRPLHGKQHQAKNGQTQHQLSLEAHGEPK